MEREAIDKALKAAGYDGSFDQLSSAEEQRARALLGIRDGGLFRRHVIGTADMIERLAGLRAATPNFAAVTDIVRRAVTLSMVSGYPLRVPPVMMLGAPGVGKTRYSGALAAALGTSLDVINGASIPDSGSITGYPPVWRGAGPGRLAKTLLAAPTSGPLLLVDEAEKIVDQAHPYPLDRLLAALERQSAATYSDENLQVPMRAEHVTWLFAANTLDGLSAPVRDRIVIVAIPDLWPEQRTAVLEVMLAEVARENGLTLSLAHPGVLGPIESLGLRRCRLALEIAVACAVEAQRRFLRTEDLDLAVRLLASPSRSAIGFIQTRDTTLG